jgi:hypothetical protein
MWAMDIDVKSLENYYFCCFYFGFISKTSVIKVYEFFLLDEEKYFGGNLVNF